MTIVQSEQAGSKLGGTVLKNLVSHRAYFFGGMLLLALVALSWPNLVQAQLQTQATVAERIQASLETITANISEIEAALKKEDVTEEELTKYRSDLESLDAEIVNRVSQFLPDVQQLETQISRLPAPPAEGEPAEAEEIQAERTALSQRKANATIAIKDAEILSIKAASLVERVLEARRALFVSSILRRRTIDSEVFESVSKQAPQASSRIWEVISSWFGTTLATNVTALLSALGTLIVVSFGFHWLARPIRLWEQRLKKADEISALQKIMLAFFPTVVSGVFAVAIGMTLHYALQYFGLYRLRINDMVFHFILVVVALWFIWNLLKAVLAPKFANLRLLTMTDKAATRLFWAGFAMAVVYGADYYISKLISLFSLPISFTIVSTLAATALIVMILIAIVMTRLNVLQPEAERSGYRGWNPIIYWLVWLSIAAIVISTVLGYVSLSRFMVGQMVISGSLLAIMYIGFLTSKAISAQGALESTMLGKYLSSSKNYTDFRLDQFGLVFSILTNVAVLCIGVPLLLLQWGVQTDEILSWASSAFTGFSIGGVQVSIARILIALCAFAALIFATRFVQRWFDGKVLARTQLDSGVKNSIKSGVGYIGFFIAALVGISWAGFNLSNIALIAGALSVGIGFGLQNIVNNFVSGIIMLIERPIKVGDIISVAGSEGFVRKINVRATELETFDRQSVIIPNSEVINTSVGNWMHTDHMRRIVVAVGVAYGSDIERVRELLLECVKADSRVASFPAPFVHFSDFGASSLDFQLRFFIRDLMLYPVVETDVRFAIDKAFRENDIEIPFPQTDLHIRSGLPHIKSK